MALGNNTTAAGNSSTAIGYNASALGSGATALGVGASAAGLNAMALGNGSSVAGGYSNSVAIGPNAAATRSNQIIMGAAGVNTVYTLPGLAANGNFINDRNQNSGAKRMTTVDSNGNLGTTSFNLHQLDQALNSINNQVMNVGALAAALSAVPNLTSNGEKYGCGLGTGLYGSGFAGAAGCVAKIGNNTWINGGLAVTGSNSTAWGSTPAVAGRLGVFFQWGGANY
jgi:hypothetical protein